MSNGAIRPAVCAVSVFLLTILYVEAADPGVIVTRQFRSNALARDWSYSVYLPAGYESSGLQYPVLYLLHGNGGNLFSWRDSGIQSTLDSLIAAGTIPPAIAVMPDAGASWYVNRREQMESAIIGDLLADVERTFRVIGGRAGRVLGGMSMGGYGALRFAFKYPQRFAAAALFYPAIYEEAPPANSAARRVGVFGDQTFDLGIWKTLNYPALWDDFLSLKTPVPMFIVSGDDDDFFIEAESANLYARLRKGNQPAELRIVNGGHDWSVVAATIAEAFQYIFRFAASPSRTGGR